MSTDTPSRLVRFLLFYRMEWCEAHPKTMLFCAAILCAVALCVVQE